MPKPELKALLFDLGDTLIEEKIDEPHQLHKLSLRLKPFAHQILEVLARRYQIAIVSDTETSPESSVWLALGNLGVNSYISAIVTSTDLGVTKPHPQMFLTALRRLGAQPNEAIMIGNDPDRDICGAHALGITTVLYKNSKYNRPGAEMNADFAIESLEQLPAIIEQVMA